MSRDLNKVKEWAMQLVGDGRRNITGREKAGVYLGCWRNTKEASEAGARTGGAGWGRR